MSQIPSFDYLLSNIERLFTEISAAHGNERLQAELLRQVTPFHQQMKQYYPESL